MDKDSTVSTVPSRMATEGDVTQFELGGLAGSSSDYFEGELGEVVVIPKLLSNNARAEWYANGIAPLNTGTQPDTVYGVVKHYTWHNELTDQTAMGTDLSVADGSISYVTSTYVTNFEATMDSTAAICDSSCANSMTYVMWAGQQVILEDRQRLDNTTTDSTYYGVVSYTHGGGIDRPLAVWRVDEADDICVIVPHFNWRGQFTERVEGGLTPAGTTCGSELPITARDFRLLYGGNETPETLDIDPVWFGSLLTGSADGSGLMYRRARYYDPMVGQFTQIDPIGMRGGLNLYGYANGDPVNFRDPSGLMAECDPPGTPECPVLITGDEITVNVPRYDPDEMLRRHRLDGATRYCGPGRLLFMGTCEELSGNQRPLSGGGGGGGGVGATGLPAKPDFAEESLLYWIERCDRTGNNICIMGHLAALGQKDTVIPTAITLAGGYIVRVIGPFTTRGVPRKLQRIRRFIRFDPPHHGKGWHWDGDWFKRF